MNETLSNILVIAGMVALIAFSIVMRRKRSSGNPLMDVARIMIDLNRNEKLADKFSSTSSRVKKFKTGAWRKKKDKVGFLGESIMTNLSAVFGMAEEYNTRIEQARKTNNTSYLVGIDVSKLREPVATSRQQLRVWFQENMYNPQYQPRRRGLFNW